MSDVEIDYSKIGDCPEEGMYFFKVMMRLEFALKDMGYCQPGRDEAVEVQWDRYANEVLRRGFFEEVKASKSAEVLIYRPPKKQVVKACNELDWKECGTVTSVQDLLGAVRRVRNNLFHGGKSGEPDRDRNDKLISGALYVVGQMLKQDKELRITFSGKY